MKTLKAFEFKPAVGSQGTQYDWDTLLSGDIYQLEEGKDFTCKASTFSTLARAAAKRKGLKLQTGKVDGGIVIQALPGDETATEENGEAAPEAVEEAAAAPAAPPKPKRKK